MLKYTPTPEERALLDEHADEMEHLARADRLVILIRSFICFKMVKWYK